MSARLIKSVLLSAVLVCPTLTMIGCADEVSHTESDKPGWFGGRKHEETTVYKNSDGTTHVEHEETKVNP